MDVLENDQFSQYWPFSVSQEEVQKPEEAEKIRFLESASFEGFESYRRFRGYEHVAKSESRSGSIIQLVQKDIWELELYEKNNILLTAFVSSFTLAGTAVISWLKGDSRDEILKNLNEDLVVPNELDYSFKTYDANIYFNFQYWPFPVSEIEKSIPEEAEKIEFLKSAYLEGFDVYRDFKGDSYYCARFEARVGDITRRGKTRWQIQLHEGIEERLFAYVTEFKVAGEAVKAWLTGCPLNEITEYVSKYLTSRASLESSINVYDPNDEQHWPFPINEENKKRPEEAEKIKFLEDAYSDGFDAYRVCRDEVRYTATSPLGIGHIVKAKKGNCWQLRVSGGGKQLMAFVTEFRAAGEAVRACLKGSSMSEILKDIDQYLIIPPKSKTSYKLN